ncbi:MAG: hypothetical protein AB8B82_08085 [Roseovarius sp.]
MSQQPSEITVQRLPADVLSAVYMGVQMGTIAVTTPLFDSASRIVHIGDSSEQTLWEGTTGTAPQVLWVDEITVLAWVAGEVLLAITHGSDGVISTELRPAKGTTAPEIIAHGSGGLIAMRRGADGLQLSGLTLSENGYAYAKSTTPLPDIAHDSRVSALCDMGQNGMLMLADNARKGFEGWHLSADGTWQQVITKGHWRDGLNGVVSATCVHGDAVLMGAGLSAQSERVLFGLPVMPEVLMWQPDTSCQLITGELRVGPEALILPLSGAASPTGGAAGRITAICQHGDVVHLAMQRSTGSALILALTPDHQLRILQAVEGTVLAMQRDPDGANGLRVLAA